MRGTRGPAWFVPVRQHTLAWVCSKIILQPGYLRTCSRDAYFRIQGIDPPRAEIEGIVSRNVIEILEIACRTRRLILMVARDWLGSGFVPSPGGIITVGVFGKAAIYVSIVTCNENCPGNSIEQFCRCLIVIVAAR